MVMGAFQVRTTGWMFFTTMGVRKHRSVEQSAQRPVGTFPHPAEVVFLHALGVWRDRGALDAHTVPRNGPGRVHGHLIFRCLPLQKAQIVVLRAQIHIGLNQLRLDLAPQTRVISSPSSSTSGVVI